METVMKVLNFIQTYGFTIIISILVIAGLIIRIKTFFTEDLIEWLVDKVGDAESYFGSKTGQLKLRAVYDTFVSQRPIVALFISFKTFSKLVDAALEKFQDMIENNEKIREWYENKKQEIQDKFDKDKDKNQDETENKEENKEEQDNATDEDSKDSNTDKNKEEPKEEVEPVVDVEEPINNVDNVKEEYADELVPDVPTNLKTGEKKTIEKFTSKKVSKEKSDSIKTTYYEKTEKEITQASEKSSELYETKIEEVKMK